MASSQARLSWCKRPACRASRDKVSRRLSVDRGRGREFGAEYPDQDDRDEVRTGCWKKTCVRSTRVRSGCVTRRFRIQ
jgi:hypothetical protein